MRKLGHSAVYHFWLGGAELRQARFAQCEEPVNLNPVRQAEQHWLWVRRARAGLPSNARSLSSPCFGMLSRCNEDWIASAVCRPDGWRVEFDRAPFSWRTRKKLQSCSHLALATPHPSHGSTLEPGAKRLPRGRRALAAFGTLLLMPVSILGCDDGSRPEHITNSPSVDIAWGQEILLEENDTTINVTPMVSIDPFEGFVVADKSEHRIRRYNAEGGLLWQGGGRGAGPGETLEPVAAARLADGRIVAATWTGRMVIYDSSGSNLATGQLQLNRVVSLKPLSDSTVLLTAILPGSISGPRIHVVRLDDFVVERSFFEPFEMVEDPGLSSTLGYVPADVLGDTVAAAYAPVDSIFFFTTTGERLFAVKFPAVNFNVVASRPSESDFADPRRRAAWLQTFETISEIAWLSPEVLAVSYKTLEEGGATWHWAVMTLDGKLLHEEVRGSRLLTSDARRGVAYFVSPQAEVPNRWSSMWLRP